LVPLENREQRWRERAEVELKTRQKRRKMRRTERRGAVAQSLIGTKIGDWK
jgi:hypothetical protein